MSGVNGRTAMLVTDGSFDGTKAAAAREQGTRTVTPDEFAVLLQHLQPARAAERPGDAAARERQRGPSAAVFAASARDGLLPGPTARDVADAARVVDLTAPPAVVRAWAREHGYEVGVRGRLPADVLAAYVDAQKN